MLNKKRRAAAMIIAAITGAVLYGAVRVFLNDYQVVGADSQRGLFEILFTHGIQWGLQGGPDWLA